MVCEKTASAIRLENSSDLLTVNLAALPPGASVTQNLSAIPLWRYIRLVYFAPDTSTAADALQLELAISNIRQGGPWLGGELASSNANACAVFNCKQGFCAGPIEAATVTVTNISANTLGLNATATIRFTYEYPACEEDVPVIVTPCKCGGQEQEPTTPTTPTAPIPATVEVLPDGTRKFEYNDGLGRMVCKTFVIPGKFDPVTGKHGTPVGGLSCRRE